VQGDPERNQPYSSLYEDSVGYSRNPTLDGDSLLNYYAYNCIETATVVQDLPTPGTKFLSFVIFSRKILIFYFEQFFKEKNPLFFQNCLKLPKIVIVFLI
jgi:hypothetical protein